MEYFVNEFNNSFRSDMIMCIYTQFFRAKEYTDKEISDIAFLRTWELLTDKCCNQLFLKDGTELHLSNFDMIYKKIDDEKRFFKFDDLYENAKTYVKNTAENETLALSEKLRKRRYEHPEEINQNC